MKSKGSIQFRRLFMKNFRMTLLLLGLPLVILMALFTTMLVRQHLHEERYREETAFHQAVNTFDSTLSQSVQVALKLSENDSLQLLRRLDLSKNTYTKFNALAKVQSGLSAILSSQPQIDDLYAIIQYGDPDERPFLIHSNTAYHYYDALYSSTWITAQQRMSYRLNEQILSMNIDSGFVQFSEQLFYVQAMGDSVKSYIVLRLNNASMRSDIASHIGSSRFIVANDGVIFFDTEKNTHGTSLEEALKDIDLESFSDVTELGWQCVYLYDTRQTREYTTQILTTCAAITFIILVFSVFLCQKLSRNLIRPYETIFELLSHPDSAALEHYAEKYATQDELGLIYTLIHQSAYQNILLQNELSKREAALNHAQNIALRSQITPHFLFNTLEAINWRLFEKLPEEREIPKMLQKLALLFRMNLDVQENLLPLEREMIYAQAYLDLQEMRFHGQYDVVWQVEDAAKRCLVVCMCLQPLLENAISHGVTKLTGHGKLTIRARVENGDLILDVEDNGPGIDPARLRMLQETLNDGRYTSSDHVGLNNVNARIQLLHGIQYGLTVVSVPYQRTCITMRMPYTTAPDSSDAPQPQWKG